MRKYEKNTLRCIISEQKLATMTRKLYLGHKNTESQRLFRTQEYFLQEHRKHRTNGIFVSFVFSVFKKKY